MKPTGDAAQRVNLLRGQGLAVTSIADGCKPQFLSLEMELLTPSLERNKASASRCCLPVTPALGRLKQEDLEFWASMGYTARP